MKAGRPRPAGRPPEAGTRPRAGAPIWPRKEPAPPPPELRAPLPELQAARSAVLCPGAPREMRTGRQTQQSGSKAVVRGELYSVSCLCTSKFSMWNGFL